MRRGKFFFVGLPFLLLIVYLIFVPSPTITKIETRNNLGYVADGYDFRMVQLTPQDLITEQSLEIFDSAVRTFTFNSDRAYVITDDGLVNIIEIKIEPPELDKIAYFDTPGFPQSVAVSGQYIYVADGPEGIQIFSLQNNTVPVKVGIIGELGFVSDIIQFGNLTYAVRREQGVDIFDLSNLVEPKLIGHYDAGGAIGQMEIKKVTEDDGREWIQGTLLVSKRAVQIVDFSNPQQPRLLNSYDFASVSNIPIEKALIRGRRIFASRGNEAVLLTRIRDNGELELLAAITGPRAIYDFAIMGDTVILAGGSEGIQTYNFSDLENIYAVGSPYSHFWGFKIWIAILSIFFLLFWLAFFSQFVLPVRTFRQRQKIFDRLITYLLGGHGPAIFVENGRKVERAGESEKKGPGVVWLDTASAAVIRTATKFKETIGPGVHFTEKGEYLAGPLDLHIQTDSLGPEEKDEPFKEKTEDQDSDAYEQVQKRRTMTSALTRDGIEIVSRITVVFRVDTYPVEDINQPGSRFGYRTGTSEEERDAEKKDKKAIFKAISGEGINPTVSGEIPRHRVAWNQLPGRLAVDIWREHAAKFTLNELFNQTQEVQATIPELTDTESREQDHVLLQENQNTNPDSSRDSIVSLLNALNEYLSDFADWLEGRKKKGTTAAANQEMHNPPLMTPGQTQPAKMQTALQVINDMVNKRLTKHVVERLDDTGARIPGVTVQSKEYDLLMKRGLRVISVNVSNVHLNPLVEKQMEGQWTASWHNNAKAERDRIERRQKYVQMIGEEEAANNYIKTLSHHVVEQRPLSVKDALRDLLNRSSAIIARDNQLQNRMSTEKLAIEKLLLWLENRS